MHVILLTSILLYILTEVTEVTFVIVETKMYSLGIMPVFLPVMFVLVIP